VENRDRRRLARGPRVVAPAGSSPLTRCPELLLNINDPRPEPLHYFKQRRVITVRPVHDDAKYCRSVANIGGGGVIGGPPPPLGFLPPLYIITILATTIDYKYLNINYIGIWCYLLIDFSVVQYFFFSMKFWDKCLMPHRGDINSV